MKKGLSEIVCIIDRSGSMELIRKDAIGGFNSFLASQKEQPGQAQMTFVQFSDVPKVIFENKPLDKVKPLSGKTYVPSGQTALLDAVGSTIRDVGKRLSMTDESERPEAVIVVILTDGEENSSRKYTKSQVQEMIQHQQEKYSWKFIFLAANCDAFAEARKIGIDLNSLNSFVKGFAADKYGTQSAYRDITETTTSYRAK